MEQIEAAKKQLEDFIRTVYSKIPPDWKERADDAFRQISRYCLQLYNSIYETAAGLQDSRERSSLDFSTRSSDLPDFSVVVNQPGVQRYASSVQPNFGGCTPPSMQSVPEAQPASSSEPITSSVPPIGGSPNLNQRTRAPSYSTAPTELYSESCPSTFTEPKQYNSSSDNPFRAKKEGDGARSRYVQPEL
eukprot:Rmarinus@m.27383